MSPYPNANVRIKMWARIADVFDPSDNNMTLNLKFARLIAHIRASASNIISKLVSTGSGYSRLA